MRRTFLLCAIVLMVVRAGALDVTAQSNDKKVVHGFLAKNMEKKPATTFSADVAKIYLIWKGEQLQAGDQLRAIWIAEDVGDPGSEESKIGERSVIIYKSDQDGFFFVTRPRDRVWPVGKYRTEIYIGKRLVSALRFTIQPGVSVEVH